MFPHRYPQRRAGHGFSLPELLISMAIGLMILAGMATLFVNNSRAQAEIEKANRQVENGRFAIQVLAGDLRNAGYYGELNPSRLVSPAALPDPCAMNLAALVNGLALPVQGYDDPAAGTLTCLTDRNPKSDVLVVRRTATCVAGAANCAPVSAGGPYFQASLCNNMSELNSADATDFYRLDVTTATLDRHQRNCTSAVGSGTLAVVRRYLTHIYYVANNDNGSDGIPTLKRAEVETKDGALSITIVPMVEGVENLQLEYGIDNASALAGAAAGDTDGVVDLYSADPTSAAGCADDTCRVANWRNVISVKLNLLARNIETSLGHTDSNSYLLGRLANGDPNTIAAANDGYKRHAFDSLVNLPNPTGRKIP